MSTHATCVGHYWPSSGIQYMIFRYGWVGVVSMLQALACNMDTTLTQPHRISNTHWTKNNKTNVVIQQNSRKLLMMDILMSETCWAHKNWNYFTSYVQNMFRTLIYPSSGFCDYSVELPHWSYCSWFDVCWSFGVVGFEWYPCCRLTPAKLI